MLKILELLIKNILLIVVFFATVICGVVYSIAKMFFKLLKKDTKTLENYIHLMFLLLCIPVVVFLIVIVFIFD